MMFPSEPPHYTADEIRSIIKDARMSQVEAARWLGVTEVTVSRWVNSTREPSERWRYKIRELEIHARGE